MSKVLTGVENVLEVGCGDGFGTPIVSDVCSRLVATDADETFVRQAQQAGAKVQRPFEVYLHNWIDPPPTHWKSNFDALYLLDVLEHIPEKLERRFIRNLLSCLKANGMVIIGTPSLEFQAYASPQSREAHVNCKTASDLRILLKEFCSNVLIFGMNDEVVHTAFEPMSCYLFAISFKNLEQ